ncbi:S41 family peptidase [Sphingomonas sp. BK580]|uniref:S41 family peptidase n=1 Tax=Sphingomonas sp. BK580 TaxID=2586972 RepID=UPI00161367B3|nr:S41 family peptidase [Sphingomonas sp. BK580]MBB3693916.1 C-terminal processing protease CtpA/Prc [Sphingomonas sp. BK580]
MRTPRWVGALALAGLLAGCGGGDDRGSAVGTGGGSAAVGGGTGTGTGATGSTGGCTLRARQDWAFSILNEWYRYPELLASNVDPASYTTLDGYVDALTAPARAQNRDRYFTYVTSAAADAAYFASGKTAGLGVRLALTASNRLFVREAFEDTPALTAGIDRGTEILAVGTSTTNLRDISDMIAKNDYDALNAAFDDTTPGSTRVVRVSDAAGTRVVTLTTANYSLAPVSSRYGAKVLDSGGRKVGYINLRTFIASADDQLRSAFATFRARGVTDLVIDLRYNGGGLLSTAETFTDLLGGARSTSDVQAYTSYRASKSSRDRIRYFQQEAQAIAPTRVAFIGTGATASASEYVINALIPYLHGDVALIGSNTYGKPVGQLPFDNPSCSDDRLLAVSLALQNAARQGDYFYGLATKVEASCQADDDVSHALGDPAETSLRTALDYIAGRSCTPIGTSASVGRSTQLFAPANRPLTVAHPNAAQRDQPGLF